MTGYCVSKKRERNMMLSLSMMECRDQLLRMELLIKMKKDYCGLVTPKD